MRRTLCGLSGPRPVVEDGRVRCEGRLRCESCPDDGSGEWGDEDTTYRVMGFWVVLPHVPLPFLRDDSSVDVHHHPSGSVREVTRAQRERLTGAQGAPEKHFEVVANLPVRWRPARARGGAPRGGSSTDLRDLFQG